MKKLVLFICLIFSLGLYAQQASGYFTESTKGDVAAFSQKGFIYGYTDTTGTNAATNYIYSNYFGKSASLPHNSFMGSKIMVGINVTVAFSDVAATLIAQGSIDGTNWGLIDTLDTDTTPNVTGVQLYELDLTDWQVPYVRLIFNVGGLNVGTSGKLRFLYAIPK